MKEAGLRLARNKHNKHNNNNNNNNNNNKQKQMTKSLEGGNRLEG